MGDCGNLRCIQEKRHFKKELASWYKKVPYTIGKKYIQIELFNFDSVDWKLRMLVYCIAKYMNKNVRILMVDSH